MTIELAIGLVGLASLALGLLLIPLLLRHPTAPARDAYSLSVYRDQLAEIERDQARGLMDAAQAEAARTEIGRRILSLETEGHRDEPSRKPLIAAVIGILLLPVVALSIYARIGSPALPDQPLVGREKAVGDPAAATARAPDMQEALAKLRAHLKTKPDDLTGWLLLARSELGLGRFAESTEAYRRAAALSENRPDIMGDWGEAQVMAAGGTVTGEARTAFEAALRDPDAAPRSRYYLALARLQQGDAKGALQDWRALEAASPAGADWLPLLRQRIAEAAKTAGIDPEAAQPSGMPSREAVAAAAQAASGASPEDRLAMIEGMVERLAAHLEQQPDDADGWARLGRSYMVLGQPAKAREAYARAVSLRPDDAALKQALTEAETAMVRKPADPAPRP